MSIANPLILTYLLVSLSILVAFCLCYMHQCKPSSINESFTPDLGYRKELQLFKSMGPKEQQEYLDLSKQSKLDKYSHILS